MKAVIMLLCVALLTLSFGDARVQKHFYQNGKKLFVFREDGVWLNYHSAHNYGEFPPNNHGIWEKGNGTIKLWSKPKIYPEAYLTEMAALTAEQEQALSGFIQKWKAEMEITVSEYDAMMVLQRRYMERFCAIIAQYHEELKGDVTDSIEVTGGTIILNDKIYTYISERDFLNLKLRHPKVKN